MVNRTQALVLGFTLPVHQDRDVQGRDAEAAGDLEYDLAHDATVGAAGGGPGPRREPVYVATQTEDDDGDYGYDLAYDVPGR